MVICHDIKQKITLHKSKLFFKGQSNSFLNDVALKLARSWVFPGVMMNYQPTQCTIFREIPQRKYGIICSKEIPEIYHIFQ